MESLCDLLRYELGIMRDAETTGRELFDALGHQVRHADLAGVLRIQGQDLDQRLTNITRCLQALGGSSGGTASGTVESLRSKFEALIRLRPAPEVVDLFAWGTATAFLNLAITGYRMLVDWATLVGETECAQSLRLNLGQLERCAGRLTQLGHEMGAALPVG